MDKILKRFAGKFVVNAGTSYMVAMIAFNLMLMVMPQTRVAKVAITLAMSKGIWIFAAFMAALDSARSVAGEVIREKEAAKHQQEAEDAQAAEDLAREATTSEEEEIVKEFKEETSQESDDSLNDEIIKDLGGKKDDNEKKS